jgi:hypothetical protein
MQEGPRRPGAVPDDVATPRRVLRVDVRGGVDSDGDGHADTVLTGDGDALLVHTDLDGDGLSDQLLAVTGDGGVHEVALDAAGPDTPGCLPGEV